MTREDIKVDYGDGFILSEQQIDIIEAVNINKQSVCIAAKSGASKTTSVQMALRDKTNTMKSGLFMAFNKAIAKEMNEENPEWITTSTIHALAYKYVVGPNGLKVRNRADFNDFKALSYSQRSDAMTCLKKYCQSDVTKVSDFCTDPKIANAVKDLMNRMLHGEVPITFDVYLKWFSLYLQLSLVEIPELDVVIIDEFQDMSPCMASIFLLYPAKQKIGVGDNAQRVNGFMGSSDALAKLMVNPDFKLMQLTSTQRCTPEMAAIAQEFSRNYIQSDFVYDGKNMSKPKFDEFMYITRTNSELIAIVPYLQSMGIKFTTTRKVNVIYHVYLMIQFNAKREYEYYTEHHQNSDTFKKEDIRFVKEYSNYMKDEHIRSLVFEGKLSPKEAMDKLSPSLQQGYKDYFKKNKDNRKPHFTFVAWITKQDLNYEHQDMVLTAKSIMVLIEKKVNIYESYQYARELEKTKEKYSLVISTGNSAKGLTCDHAYFSDGLNKAFNAERNRNYKLIEDDPSLAGEDWGDDNNELEADIANLYYMAFTRARYSAGNALHITSGGAYPGSTVKEQDFFAHVVKTQKVQRI